MAIYSDYPADSRPGIPYRTFVLLIQPALTGIGEPGVSLKNTVTTFLVVSSGMVLGIPWELTGLCIGELIGAMISVTVNLNRSLALLDMRYAQLLELSLPSMFAAAVMYAALLIAQHGWVGE